MASCTDYNIIIANKKYKKSKRPLQIKIVNYSRYLYNPPTRHKNVPIYICFSITDTKFHKNHLTFNILMNQ